MSHSTTVRLSYADAETPGQMHTDCRVVSERLHVAAREPRRDKQSRADSRPDPRTVSWAVSDRAAAFAGGLHLHLD